MFLAIIAVSAQFGRFFGRSTGFLIFSPLSPFLLVSAYFWYIPQPCWDVVLCLNLTALGFRKREKALTSKNSLAVFLIHETDKLRFLDRLRCCLKQIKSLIFTAFPKQVEKTRTALPVLTAFPLRLVKRTLLFWKRAVLGRENGPFPKNTAKGGRPPKPAPSFSYAATR